MNTDIKILPLEFDRALQYITEQLQDGNALSQVLLKKLDFKKGSFFALLHPSADKDKIHDFHSGGILKENPLERVSFQGKTYSGRKTANSITQLAQYLQKILQPGQGCYFEDIVHYRSDPIASELKKRAIYFQNEIYFYIKEEEFSQETAEKIIHYADAQWHYMNVISDSAPGFEPDLNPEKLETIALNTTLLVIGAYDMEGSD